MKRRFIKQPQTIQCATIASFKEAWQNEELDTFDLEQEYLVSLEDEVLDEMGLWLEPSTQGNAGGIWIYTEGDNETVVAGYDYPTYVDEVTDIASSCENDEEFKQQYKAYIESLMDGKSGASSVDEDSESESEQPLIETALSSSARTSVGEAKNNVTTMANLVYSWLKHVNENPDDDNRMRQIQEDAMYVKDKLDEIINYFISRRK